MPNTDFLRKFFYRTACPALFLTVLSACAHQTSSKSLAPGPNDNDRLPGISVSGHSRMFHAENKKTEPLRIYSTTSPPPPVRTTTAPAPAPPPPPHPVRKKKHLPLQKDIFFAFNSHRVSYANRSVLLAYARLLRKNPSLTIILYGHTDPVGGKKYNRTLGFKRALAAKKILEKARIPARRIQVFSEGKRPSAGFPECKKPSPVCYARDRAVRIRVVRKGSLSGISGIHKPKRKR